MFKQVLKVLACLVAEHGLDGREVYCAGDAEEACSLFNIGILPTLEDASQDRVKGLRQEIIDGKSWVFVSEDERYRTCYYVNLYPSMESTRYGFRSYAGNQDLVDGRFDPDCENRGFYSLNVELTPESELPYERLYEETVNRMSRIKCDYCRQGDAVDAVAVVDVIDVQLAKMSGFDKVRRYPSSTFLGSECEAVYDVIVDVRKIEKGEFVSDWYIIEVPCTWTDFVRPGSFLYYRGMTLRIGLKRKDTSWALCEASPVLPYSPYSGEEVIVSGGCLVEGGGLRDGRMLPLVVEYGHHTKVEYSSGEFICRSMYGMFSDFGTTSRVKVLELRDGSDRQYWNGAWFVKQDVSND